MAYVKTFEQYSNTELDIIKFMTKVREELKNFVPSESAVKVEKSLDVENFELQTSWLVSTYWKFDTWKKDCVNWEETDCYKYQCIFDEWVKQFPWCKNMEDSMSRYLGDESFWLNYEVNDCSDIVEFSIRIE